MLRGLLISCWSGAAQAVNRRSSTRNQLVFEGLSSWRITLSLGMGHFVLSVWSTRLIFVVFMAVASSVRFGFDLAPGMRSWLPDMRRMPDSLVVSLPGKSMVEPLNCRGLLLACLTLTFYVIYLCSLKSERSCTLLVVSSGIT